MISREYNTPTIYWGQQDSNFLLGTESHFMTWILGIDEAGYGPNLGPFIMTSVAVKVADEHKESNLWSLLPKVVRRGKEKRDGRLFIDDSKVVYSSGKGLAELERGVWSIFNWSPTNLKELVDLLSPDTSRELSEEYWFTGSTSLPEIAWDELPTHRDLFAQCCEPLGIHSWKVRSVVVCPRRFNAIIHRHNSKSAVLGEGFIRLVEHAHASLPPEEPLAVFIDKQGGRNTYAAQIQQALPNGFVLPREESAVCSRYQVVGLNREIHLTFKPRMDGEQFCVALASMVSKYLRERCMSEFNRFWQQHIPDLPPTAGYPGDAPRFFEAIRHIATTLQIPEEAIWRLR